MHLRCLYTTTVKSTKDFGVTRGDASFLGVIVQLPAPEFWWCADRVKRLFRRSNENQKRYGEVVSRKKTMVGASEFDWDSMPPSVSHLRGEAGVFEVFLELMLLYPSLNVSCPLATYADGNKWRVWARPQATVSLRDRVEASVGIGRVCLAFGKDWRSSETCSRGVSTIEIQRQGRWKSDAFIMYVRATRDEDNKVSRVLASNAGAGGIQPGQGTK